jgi:hypothetical protein
MYIAPWWSKVRDQDLRQFWMSGDHISGAVYTMQSKMEAIPRKVVARDPTVKEHVVQAEEMTEWIQQTAQFGEGWEAFFGKCVQDLTTQDNGFMAEIIGPGRKDGPLTGRPLSIAHLDSGQCVRTGNAQWPIVYEDLSGKFYKLHWTRIMFGSQMTSPRADMHGVGFCAVSRAIQVAQTLIDVLLFKQEKMGSRPHTGLLVTSGGLDPEDVRGAFEVADARMDQEGLRRFSKIVVTGSSAMPEADLKQFNFAELPDGFDERTSIELGIATIALAFGVDARELFPAMQSGATRADALVSHLKQRGKGPGQIIQLFEQQMNMKYLPPQLRFEFDFQDDAQDRQVADIRNVRATRRTQDIGTTALDVRTARALMVEDGDLKQSQFEMMELRDGRLPDGSPLFVLFKSDDPAIKRYLDLGVDDPFDIESNDVEAMLTSIWEKAFEAMEVITNEKDHQSRRIAWQAVMALAKLEQHYKEEPKTLADMFLSQSYPEGEFVDTRTRTENPTEPNEEEEGSVEGRHGTSQSSDEKPTVSPNEGPK